MIWNIMKKKIIERNVWKNNKYLIKSTLKDRRQRLSNKIEIINCNLQDHDTEYS